MCPAKDMSSTTRSPLTDPLPYERSKGLFRSFKVDESDGPYVVCVSQDLVVQSLPITHVFAAPESSRSCSSLLFEPNVTVAKYEKSVPSSRTVRLLVCEGAGAEATSNLSSRAAFEERLAWSFA